MKGATIWPWSYIYEYFADSIDKTKNILLTKCEQGYLVFAQEKSDSLRQLRVDRHPYILECKHDYVMTVSKDAKRYSSINRVCVPWKSMVLNPLYTLLMQTCTCISATPLLKNERSSHMTIQMKHSSTITKKDFWNPAQSWYSYFLDTPTWI